MSQQPTSTLSIQDVITTIKELSPTTEEIQKYLLWVFKTHYRYDADLLLELIENNEYQTTLADCLSADEIVRIGKIVGLYMSYY